MSLIVNTNEYLANQLVTGGPPGSDESGQYLTFSLGKETFAIGILHTREILEYGQLSTVPMMPAFVRGVINLRGAVVPVVDLAVRFGRESVLATPHTCIVIVDVATGEGCQEIGVVVDAVSAVLDIPDSEIESPPTFGARLRTDFIQGMGKVDGEFVILLNMDKVLSVEDLALITQAAETIQHHDAD